MVKGVFIWQSLLPSSEFPCLAYSRFHPSLRWCACWRFNPPPRWSPRTRKALSVSHLLNDTIQSLIAAVYPVLKESYTLTFTQIGLITLAFQFTSSLLQPLVGWYTDRRPLPFSLAIGMGVTLSGLLLLSVADTFPVILVAVALVGVGSAIFHPEASRMARLASGRRLGPLLAAFVVVPWGQGSLAWFSVAALAAMTLLFRIGLWYRAHLAERLTRKSITVELSFSTLWSRFR